MEHYGEAMEYAEIATGSAGTAVEKYNAWLEGIEGKLNTLKTTFQELAMAILDSELITGVFDFVTWLLEALTGLVDIIGGLNTVLYATVAIVAILKADAIITFIMSIGTAITKVIGFITSFIASIKIAKAEGISAGQFISNAFHQITAGASTAQLAVAAFVAVISALLIAVNLIKQSQDKALQTAMSSAQGYLSEAQAAKEDADSLDALIKKYVELAEKNNGVWDDETAQTVKGIQDEIVDLVGDQALAIDLVNGKLETELGILKDIAGESNKIALESAQSALKDAEVAVQSSMSKWRTGDNSYFDIGTGGKKTYGRVKTETVTRSVMGAGSMKYDTIVTEFDTAKEFAEQYEAVLEYKNSIAGTLDETNTWQVEMYKEVNEFLSEFKDVYTNYKSAQDLITQLTAPANKDNDNTAESIKGVTVALKSAYEILDEVADGYDGIAGALTDVTSGGYLTADALSTLFKLEKDNALAGLQLSKILTRDANGYKLAEDALQQYVQALIAAYTVEGAFATQKDKENAIANLQTLQAVLATLAATQNESTDASKARREELEKEQDMYQDQLDKFEELIDLRKDLLQTYKEELDYQKELEKRQRNVTALQTRLSVAKLDQSAAGQARVRELEAELKEAQDELEDFTLEHAIDVLTDQLDSANAEWKAIIQGKLNEITNLLEALDTTPEVNVTTDTSWVQGAISQIEGLIEGINQGDVGMTKDEAFKAAQDYITSHGMLEGDKNRWGQDANFLPLLRAYLDAGGSINDLKGNTNTIKGGSKEVARKAAQDYIDSHGMLEGDKARWGQDPNFLPLLRAYIATGGSINDLTGKARTYHTGGLVGDIASLSSSEEFAKLLKGEFVSTPAQMKRFMEETLPRIANYTATGGTNEFNAPLIEILCESVTSESLPELKNIVEEAVKELQKQLDSGMSRTGFKRTPTKRLT